MPYPEGLSLDTIWDEIAHFLDSTKDLLSLASTCHTFKELIIPDHLHYRHLSVNICKPSVWEFLERRPRLGKSVRSIELSNKIREDFLPPALSVLTKRTPANISDKDIAAFKSAVSCIPLLKNLYWDCMGSGSPEQLIDISHTLTTSAPCLEGLDINLSDLTIMMPDQQQMKRLSIWSLTSLKRVILRTSYPSPDGIRMILSCPNIEDLYSEATSSMDTFPFYLMQQANWKNLRRLEFQELSLQNEEERDIDISAIVTSFFVQHPNIECLRFYASSDTPVPTLPPSSLPKLRSFSSDLSVVTSLLSRTIMSRLVHLTCTVTEVDPSILPQMDKLESLRLFGNANGNGPELIDPFLSKAPSLKKISVDIRDISMLHFGYTIKSPPELHNKDTQDQYIALFLKYPQSKLTHICIISPMIIRAGTSDDDKIKSEVGVVCEKLSALRALRYAHIDGGYVELERDENGMYYGCHSVSLNETGHSSSWGGFFFDLSD
ncbi:hypothetical protein Clacol_010429 [Clathrus columnatus]|uniref:F-box domain-containing protein n=1 Tax=Clathrus columnatus TaxID=1419009 RepID=A0AAV5ATR5_9AGAM|nr:hypothetical protein Clacol_010429 [Clathrus columnatus]